MLPFFNLEINEKIKVNTKERKVKRQTDSPPVGDRSPSIHTTDASLKENAKNKPISFQPFSPNFS